MTATFTIPISGMRERAPVRDSGAQIAQLCVQHGQPRLSVPVAQVGQDRSPSGKEGKRSGGCGVTSVERLPRRFGRGGRAAGGRRGRTLRPRRWG
jgi:hypothetical protein